MEKTDLCAFMCGSVAAAISGEEAKAAVFLDGLRLLQPHFTPPELAEFMCNPFTSRLKKKKQGIPHSNHFLKGSPFPDFLRCLFVKVCLIRIITI